MKRLSIICMAALLLVACGKGKSPESMARAICDCNKKLAKMNQSDPGYAKEQKACFDKQLSAREAFEKDEEKMNEFNRLSNECAMEMYKETEGK